MLHIIVKPDKSKNMQYLKLMIICFATFFISGCITTSYVPPQTGPIATITGVQNTYYSIFLDARTCTETRSIWQKQPNKISAGKLNTLMAGGLPGGTGCPTLVFSFVPKANNNYQVFYNFVSQGFKNEFLYGQRCAFKLINLTTNETIHPIIRNFYLIPINPVLARVVGCKDDLARVK
jgi:hypothetical protein